MKDLRKELRENPRKLALLVGSLAIVLYVGARVSWAARSLSSNMTCTRHATIPGGAILVACIAAFVAGHVLTRRRDHHPGRRESPEPRHWWTKPFAVHIALAVFFACAFVTLAYETLGVWGDAPNTPWGIYPLTSYVRCARDISTPSAAQTMAISVVVSFVLGHWLWFPGRRRRP
jgi:hypothetical protein